MKKKFTFLTVLLFFVNTLLFAELLKDKGFIGDLGWTYKNGGAVLNGKKFYYVADSYREQRGVFYVADGYGIDCWLYDTYSYHNGDGTAIYNKYLPEFFKSCRCDMEWYEVESRYVPDKVKNLMKQRNCDIAIYSMIGCWWVINYDKRKNSYSIDMFQVYP